MSNILVLGIGNLLWADEAFGVRAVEELHRHYEFSGNVRLMDGGTQGLYLVPYVREADKLLVFDALDYGLEAGTMKLVRDEEVPNFTGVRKMSLHQTGFQDVLSAADLLGGGPLELLLIGVQAASLEQWGAPLSDCVRARIEPALDIAVEQLRCWGAGVRQRRVPPATNEGLLVSGIDFANYEGRPAEGPPS